MFVGEIKVFAGELTYNVRKNLRRRGYLPCEGQEELAERYEALATLLGWRPNTDGNSIYGKPSVSTRFVLPDLRGRVPMGSGQGPDTKNRTLGRKIGKDRTKLTVGQLPSHQHLYDGPKYKTMPAITVGGEDLEYCIKDRMRDNAKVGNNESHSNIQPSTVVNYLICVWGFSPLNPPKDDEIAEIEEQCRLYGHRILSDDEHETLDY